MLFTVIPFILGVVIYNANFGGRIETAEALHYDINEFPGLEREQIDIRSDNDVKLGAWIYSNNTLDKPKALIVTLHIYYEKYANDQRFEFVWVEGKGHMDVYGTDELTKYLKSVNINTIDQNTLDKSKFKELDPDMMNKMTSFFDSCLYANSQ